MCARGGTLGPSATGRGGRAVRLAVGLRAGVVCRGATPRGSARRATRGARRRRPPSGRRPHRRGAIVERPARRAQRSRPTANKLLARKRPRLIPVHDSVLAMALQPDEGEYWETLRAALRDGLQAELAASTRLRALPRKSRRFGSSMWSSGGPSEATQTRPTRSSGLAPPESRSGRWRARLPAPQPQGGIPART